MRQSRGSLTIALYPLAGICHSESGYWFTRLVHVSWADYRWESWPFEISLIIFIETLDIRNCLTIMGTTPSGGRSQKVASLKVMT